MPGRKNTLWLSLLSAVAVGCGPKSTLGPNQAVTVTGRVDGSAGSPLPGAQVGLLEEPDVGQALGEGFAVVVSLGLACLSSDPPSLCSGSRQTSTDSSGDFSFSLLGSQTQGSEGEADTFIVSSQQSAAAGQVGGPSASEQFVINTATLSLPDLRLWEPAVGFEGNASTASVTFDAVPASYGANSQTSVSFSTASGALVWSQPAHSGDSLDARLLEDATGGASVAATTTGSATATSISFSYQSPGTPFSGTAGPAPSRGAACFLQGASGPIALSPCSLTDGDFGTPVQLVTCTGSACNSATLDNWAYVDLGASRAFSLVVVRGTSSSAIVESSTDASTWTALSSNAQAGVFSVASAGTARYIRVRAQSPTASVEGLAEISVW
ncbi:MAG: hypothetical protein ACYDCL_13920 [Myxococcales bacterium]